MTEGCGRIRPYPFFCFRDDNNADETFEDRYAGSADRYFGTGRLQAGRQTRRRTGVGYLARARSPARQRRYCGAAATEGRSRDRYRISERGHHGAESLTASDTIRDSNAEQESASRCNNAAFDTRTCRERSGHDYQWEHRDRGNDWIRT